MFQKKIVQKYLFELDQKNLESKYEKFKSIFANEKKQENIRNSKHLSKERFKLLYLLLSLESVKDDIPLKLKKETASEEKEITKKETEEKAFDWAREFPEVFFRSERLGNRSEELEDRNELVPRS